MSDTNQSPQPRLCAPAILRPFGGLTLGGRPACAALDEGLGFAADLRGRAVLPEDRPDTGRDPAELRLVASHGRRLDA